MAAWQSLFNATRRRRPSASTLISRAISASRRRTSKRTRSRSAYKKPLRKACKKLAGYSVIRSVTAANAAFTTTVRIRPTGGQAIIQVNGPGNKWTIKNAKHVKGIVSWIKSQQKNPAVTSWTYTSTKKDNTFIHSQITAGLAAAQSTALTVSAAQVSNFMANKRPNVGGPDVMDDLDA